MIGGEFDLSAGVAVTASALVASMISYQFSANMFVGVLVALVVSLVIVAVLRSWPATMAFVLVMLIVAAWTAGRRMTRDRSGLGAGLALLAGTVPVVAVDGEDLFDYEVPVDLLRARLGRVGAD